MLVKTFDVQGRLDTVTDGAAVAATYTYNADSTTAGIKYSTGISMTAIRTSQGSSAKKQTEKHWIATPILMTITATSLPKRKTEKQPPMPMIS